MSRVTGIKFQSRISEKLTVAGRVWFYGQFITNGDGV